MSVAATLRESQERLERYFAPGYAPRAEGFAGQLRYLTAVDDRRRAIVSASEAGWTDERIADELGVGAARVGQLRREEARR